MGSQTLALVVQHNNKNRQNCVLTVELVWLRMGLERLTILKILVGIVVPALISANAVIAKNQGDITGWLKYWVMVSVCLVLELSLTSRLKTRAAETVKILLLLWCLTPLPGLNGADLVFDWILTPLHWSLITLWSLLRPVAISVSAHLNSFTRLVCSSIVSVASDLPGLMGSLCDSLLKILNDLPGLAHTISAGVKDGVMSGSLQIYSFTVTSLSHVVHVITVLATSINSSALNLLSYYRSNQRHPRLISQVLKQMIYK